LKRLAFHLPSLAKKVSQFADAPQNAIQQLQVPEMTNWPFQLLIIDDDVLIGAAVSPSHSELPQDTAQTHRHNSK
jgi:hypothetical protein